jgi:drug/metabolite transporter (DMT)-like permease
MPPFAVVAWQVGLGCLAMLIIGVLFEHPHYAGISSVGIACFVYMTLVPMGICYLTWFETLRRLPPVSASTGICWCRCWRSSPRPLSSASPWGCER